MLLSKGQTLDTKGGVLSRVCAQKARKSYWSMMTNERPYSMKGRINTTGHKVLWSNESIGLELMRGGCL